MSGAPNALHRARDSGRYVIKDTPARYAVMLNARARGWNGEVHQAIGRFVSAKDLFLTDDFHQARRTVDKLLRSDYDAIFAGGGDGTIMYLVNELERRIRSGEIAREDAPPIGVLRLGTGNALATYLESQDILDDLRALSHGAKLIVHSVGMLEDSTGELFPFAGVGWDAEILNDYDNVKDLARDTAAEPYATGLTGYGAAIATRTIPRVLAQAPPRLTITNLEGTARRLSFDGEVIGEYGEGEVIYEGPARICSAATVPFWGFQVRMFPHADADPDRFQMRCYHGGIPEILLNLRDMWRGRVREENVHDVLASHVRVEVDGEALPYQVSGDAAGVEREIEWRLAAHPIKLATPHVP